MKFLDIKVPSIYAKLKGMQAQKIKNEQKEELIKQTSITQVTALLKSYNSKFKDLDENPERSNIEILLDKMLIQDIQKIIGMLNKKDKFVFLQYLSVYEIKCIKSVFHRLMTSSTLKQELPEVENWTNKVFTHLAGIEKITE